MTLGWALDWNVFGLGLVLGSCPDCGGVTLNVFIGPIRLLVSAGHE